MKKFFLFTSFVFGNFTILFLCFLFLTIKTTKQSSAQTESPVEIVSNLSADLQPFTPLVLNVPSSISAQIIAGDASEQIVENYLKKYNSPMVGTGKDIVTAARKYQIPFGLLPAIGQCEGNLGKTIPNDSYNTWGFGVYGGQVKRFASWQDAIEAVSKGIRTDYFDLGLTTPETMMPKYTPPSDGSWARCVNRFLTELQ